MNADTARPQSEDELRSLAPTPSKAFTPSGTNAEEATAPSRPIQAQPDFRLYFGSLFGGAQPSEGSGRFSLLMSGAPALPLPVNTNAFTRRQRDGGNQDQRANSCAQAAAFPAQAGQRSSSELGAHAEPEPHTSSDDSISSMPELVLVSDSDADTTTEADDNMDTDEPLTSSDEERNRDALWAEAGGHHPSSESNSSDSEMSAR